MAIIYKITNKINGKFYIGKTLNIKKRLSGHKCDRRRITHFTKAIDKYGWNNFECIVIWKGSQKHVNEKEIYYIKKYNAIKEGYNCTTGGDGFPSGERHPYYGKSRPAGVKKKISESKKKWHPMKGKKMPQWWIDKCRPGKGEKHHNSKEYIIISPDGIEQKIKGIVNFCQENGLQYTNMLKVASGKRNHCGGWKCRRINDSIQ